MNAEIFLDSAKQNLRDAALLLDAGSAKSACNRAYYAMHDAARAALIVAGRDREAQSKTHSGLIAQFNLHLVKTGLLALENSRRLANASNQRIIADYDGVAIAIETSKSVVADAEQMIDDITNLLESPS